MHKIEGYGKFNIQNVLWYFILMPLLKTNGLIEHYSTLSKVNNVFALLSVVILVYFFVNSRHKRYGNIICTLSLFLFIIFRTIQNGTGEHIRNIIIPTIYCLGIILFINVLSNKPVVLIKSFLINLEIAIYVNLITLFFFPDGLYKTGSGNGLCWFLGYDNWWYIIFYVAYYFSILHCRYTKKIARTIVLIACLHISAIITMSGVLLFGVILMDLLVFFGFYRRKIFSYLNIWIAGIVTNIGLISFYSSYLIVYIVQLLNRPVSTLIVRTQIWNATIAAISRNMLLGYGRQTVEDRIRMYFGMTSAVNAHNMWLEILYEGGLIGAILMTAIVVLAGKTLLKIERNEAKQLLLVCLLTCIVGLSVDSVFLELRGNLFFALFAIANNMDRIVSKLPAYTPRLFNRKVRIWVRKKS